MSTFSPVNETLQSLFQRSSRMIEVPEYQREEVWSLSMKQLLIDSIFRGIPIPAITMQRVSSFWGIKDMIVDGQQRLSAIFGYMRDEFPTSKRTLEHGIRALEAGKKYSQLPQEARDRFDTYKLSIMELVGEDADVSLCFRRWNSGKILTFAEKLYSMNSHARNLSVKIFENDMFSTMFTGKGRHKEFQVFAHTILLEKSDSGFANTTNPRLTDAILSIGENERELEKNILSTLDDVCRLFSGYEFSSIAEIIFLYQAAKFLRQDRYNIRLCSLGILTPWAMKHKEAASSITYTSKTVNVYRLHQTFMQRKFWEKELPIIEGLVGVPKLDDTRLFTKRQKLIAFNRQRGICPVCSKELSISDDGHHAIPYRDGGKTDADNCILVHPKCHDVFTEVQPNMLEVTA